MQTSRAINVVIFAGLLLLLYSGVSAQFNSGSTGADGALDLATMNCPNNTCYVQLPESGILNYTTISIPAGKVLRFKVNSRNTPATVLAQGPVVIDGHIDGSSRGDVGVCGGPPSELAPGGFRGGQSGMNGFGPGGGTQSQANATWVGPLNLVPASGGSGGYGDHWSGGGRGGGAITIASSSSIIGTGQITANGSSNSYYWQIICYSTSSGSGGSIRLVANSITFGGNLSACGAGPNSCGVIRLEAGSRTFTGMSTPAAVLADVNPTVVLAAAPILTIVSVGGHAVPTYSGSRFDTVDLLLPSQILDPVPVVVQAANIPAGSQVQVGFVNGSTSGTSTPCTLSGGPGPLSCTATISNLHRNGVTYLLATTTFAPPSLATHLNNSSAGRVARLKIEAALGRSSRVMFLDKDGKQIAQNELSDEFVNLFLQK